MYYADAGEKKAAEAAELDDRIDTLTRGFLGLTVACARCHDHKFDPIATQDYYSLAGVIRSSQYQLTAIAPPDVVSRYQQAQERIQAQDARIKAFLDEQSTRVAEGMCGETARYMTAAWKLNARRNKNPRLTAAVLAKEEKLRPVILEQLDALPLRQRQRREAESGRLAQGAGGVRGTKISPPMRRRWRR